ncbi:MAG: response regulator [Betaproteobacteria bacterium]|nr:response regulator [Betaproteobacteria bacterium]
MNAQAAARTNAALRVFVVEDSPLVLERIEAMLASIDGAQTAGHAGRADEAVRAILAAHPDAVVLDLKLAEGSGFDVLRAVRAQAPDIEFFMLSNFASEPYRRLAARLGAAHFFDKSTEFERVREVLTARAARPVH